MYYFNFNLLISFINEIRVSLKKEIRDTNINMKWYEDKIWINERSNGKK